MTSYTIEDLCHCIVTGATNSVYEKADAADAQHFLLTGSCLNQQGQIEADQLTPICVKDEKSIARFSLQTGDVVLLARGSTIRAAYVDETTAQLGVLASANFLLLRPKKEQLLGETLVAFLNSQLGIAMLEQMSTGAVIQNISASSLKKTEIPLPTLHDQQRLAELFHARNQAYMDTLALAEQQKKAADACIEQLLKGDA